MIVGLFRVVFGFIVACFAAAVAKVGFVVSPAEFMAVNEEQFWSATQLALLVATQNAVFAAPFALLAIFVAEWQAIRGWVYYVLVGLAIAAAGFLVLHTAEGAGPPSIANRYAMIAFFTAGLVGGLAYWLFSGSRAGRSRARSQRGSDTYRIRGTRDTAGVSSVIPPKPVIAKPASPIRDDKEKPAQ